MKFHYFSGQILPTVLLGFLTFVVNPTLANDHLSSSQLIRNTTIISPERQDIRENVNVLIEDGVITRITSAEINPSESTNIVDGLNQYLIPGLMDSHLHTLVMPGLGFHGGERSREFAEMTDLYQQQFERSLLYHGVTQIVDPAATADVIASKNSKTISPDMFFCGAAPLSNGYPTMFMDPTSIAKSLPYRVHEKSSSPSLASRYSPQAVVERMKSDGAICLKLFFEDGWDMRNDWPMLSHESLKKIIASAHKHNLKVLGHANALDMQVMAVNAGVDIIGHGLWNWNQYSRQKGVPAAIAKHLDSVIEKNIGYQPTMRVMDSMQELFVSSELENPALKKVVPQKLLQWYKTEAAQKFKKELAGEDFEGLPEDKIAPLLNHPISRSERTVRYLADKQYPLLLASDHPATPGHANHPGLSTYQEIRHMAKSGVSLRNIFEAATLNNARAFSLDNQFGTVEIGKKANLLLLEANPLQTVEAYDKIRWIILNGSPIERESLSAEQIH